LDVKGTYNGQIIFPTDSEGAFEGIISGGPMTVTVTYDPSQVPADGPYAYETNLGADGDITIVMGSLNLDGSMDNSDTMGWPVIQFNDAQFVGISFAYSFTSNGSNYQLLVNDLDWEITNTETSEDVASGIIIAEPT
jgi:hypothetical protein